MSHRPKQRVLPPPLPEWFPRGTTLLRDPTLNKGTAFSEAEREALGLGEGGALVQGRITQQGGAAREPLGQRRRQHALLGTMGHGMSPRWRGPASRRICGSGAAGTRWVPVRSALFVVRRTVNRGSRNARGTTRVRIDCGQPEHAGTGSRNCADQAQTEAGYLHAGARYCRGGPLQHRLHITARRHR